MTLKTRRALLSTSRHFRSQMHQTVTSVRLQSVNDIPLLVSQQWSQLKVINLTGLYDLDARSLTELAMADWPLLQSLCLRRSKIRRYIDQYAQLSPLLLAKWPLLKAIDFTGNCVHLVSWKVLAEAHWPRLRRLTLRNNCANTARLRYLLTGNWPMLEELDLSHNCLNDKRMETFSKGKWPQLKKLILQSYRDLHADDLACLTLGTGHA